ncbi:MAG: hypothetical protein OSJ72_06290 [Lachnospiraceae bacterium]|nr:hypothetical protein [Lachnospiraceae bacterium]
MKKVVISALSAVIGAVAGAVATGKEAQKTVNKTQNMSDKHLALFLMMNRWVEVKQDGKNLIDYFHEKGYKSIAIYGMSYAGERLLHELKGSDIEVKCGIDRKADEIYTEVDMITPDDEIPQVDTVIVTSIYFFDEIKEKLEALTDMPVISLEDILYEV